MSTAELKNKLIDKINSTEDVELLKDASRLLELHLPNTENAFIITHEIEEAINEAEQQIIDGKVIPHKKANDEIEEWLKK